VLNYIEMPLQKKYQNGKSKKLFLACMEMVKLGLDDKVLSIYFTALKYKFKKNLSKQQFTCTFFN